MTSSPVSSSSSLLFLLPVYGLSLLHAPFSQVYPEFWHSSFAAFSALWVSNARSIAPDDSIPAATPTPAPIIADDADVCARVRRYAFSLNVVTSMPNQFALHWKLSPAYNFLDDVGVLVLSPAKKLTV